MVFSSGGSMRKEITQADITEYLVTQSDFDLELFVDRSLQERGMTTSHGGSYFDSITGKSRQYDVRAYAYIPPHCGIFFAIECKSLSMTFPLVVSRVPRPADDAYHELIRTWGRKEAGEDFQDAIRSNERMPLYRAGTPVGKKTVQVGREERKREDDKRPFIASDGETFDKWSQALSSAEDLVQLTRQHRGENGSGNFYSVILPILVVSDNSLWVVDYSGTGNNPPQQVQETTLFVDRTYNLQQGVLKVTHLHIFTRSGFTDFLAQVGSPSPAGFRERMFGFAFRQS
jgi:hypothetical protein